MYHPNMRMLVLAGLLFTATLVNAQISNVTCSDGSTPQGRISVTGQGSVKSSPDSATVRISCTGINSINILSLDHIFLNSRRHPNRHVLTFVTQEFLINFSF